MKTFAQYINETIGKTDDEKYVVIQNDPNDKHPRWPNGTKVWEDNKGKLHRGALDKPAVITPDGTMHFYQHGEYHRDGDKPAIISPDGSQTWYKSNQVHRHGDRPAIVYSLPMADGALCNVQEYYKNNHLHRENGPAKTYSNPNYRKPMWFLNGVWYQGIKDVDDFHVQIFVRDPESFFKLKQPTKKVQQYVIKNKPWMLTDQNIANFDPDLQKEWKESRVAKARKQIGL